MGEDAIVQKSITLAEKFHFAVARNMRLLMCSELKSHFDFEFCVTGNRHALPPTITEINNLRLAAKLAPDALRDQLTWFICASMWRFYGEITLPEEQPRRIRTLSANCYGEKQLKSLLYFELIPDRKSSVPMITMKIYGPSAWLAAKKTDYWELHRLSFQFIVPTIATLEQSQVARELLVATVFDSRMQKNRDNTKGVLFEELMAPQYERDIAEFLDRILAVLSEQKEQ